MNLLFSFADVPIWAWIVVAAVVVVDLSHNITFRKNNFRSAP